MDIPIEFLRQTWFEFCAWVETCAGELAKYQDQWNGSTAERAERRQTVTDLADARKRNDKVLTAKLEKTLADQMVHVPYNALLNDERFKDWVGWGPPFGYATDGLNLPRLPFYAPREVVNPILWLLHTRCGADTNSYPNPRPPDQREKDLLAAAVLSVAHDARATHIADTVYRGEPYTKPYFLRDEVCRELATILKTEQGKTETEQAKERVRAWQRLEAGLPRTIPTPLAKPPANGTGAGGNGDGKPIIRLNQWKRGGCRNLMQDLLEDDIRAGVTIKRKRHGKSQPKELRRSLRETYKLPQVAEAIQHVEGKTRTYKLTIPVGEIGYESPRT